MLQQLRPKQDLIEGTPALIVIDIQGELFAEGEPGPIPEMPNFDERMALARKPTDKARERDMPVIFIQEVHRPDLVDFGRELDGAEDVHCLEDDLDTAIAAALSNHRSSGSLPIEAGHQIGSKVSGIIAHAVNVGRLAPAHERQAHDI